MTEHTTNVQILSFRVSYLYRKITEESIVVHVKDFCKRDQFRYPDIVSATFNLRVAAPGKFNTF